MIIGFENLSELRHQYRDAKIAFAGGVFDILHPGHVDYFNYVKSLADIAVIAVSSDARVKERKGPCRPINGQLARVIMVDSLKPIDYSLIGPDPGEGDGTPPTVRMIEALRPDYFVTQEGERWRGFEHDVTSYGGQLIIDDTPKRASTTEIIENVLRAYNVPDPQAQASSTNLL